MKGQLIRELRELCQRVAELEVLETERRKAEEHYGKVKDVSG